METGRSLIVVDLAPPVVVDPAVRFGTPVIKGTRVPVEVVITKFAGGMSVRAVANEHEVTEGDIRAALRDAAHVLASEEIRGVAWVAAFLVKVLVDCLGHTSPPMAWEPKAAFTALADYDRVSPGSAGPP